MGDFEKILPDAIIERVVRVAGSELVFPFAETLLAIEVASRHLIAVLGVEAFRVLKDGLVLRHTAATGFVFLETGRLTFSSTMRLL